MSYKNDISAVFLKSVQFNILCELSVKQHGALQRFF